MSDYKKIIAIEPDNEEARYNIGMIYLEKNDFKEAERQFDEILRYHPNSLLSNEGKAFLCKATGNYAKAASHFSEVIKAVAIGDAFGEQSRLLFNDEQTE